MIDTFGDDIYVYPLMGNHDTFPVNVQSFSVESNVFNNLSHVLSYWLHNDTLETFKKAGYYAQYFEIKGATPK